MVAASSHTRCLRSHPPAAPPELVFMFYLFIGLFSMLGIQNCKYSTSAGCSRMPVYLGTRALSKLGAHLHNDSGTALWCLLSAHFWPNKDNCSIIFFLSKGSTGRMEQALFACLEEGIVPSRSHHNPPRPHGVTLGVTRALRCSGQAFHTHI